MSEVEKGTFMNIEDTNQNEETSSRTSAFSDVEKQSTSDQTHTLKRSLKSRHLAMISLGGVIGQGLFLSAGGNLAAAGPAGALIAYAIIGFIVFWVTFALGEMATMYPVSGSFTIFCQRFVDTSFGGTIGYNYWACWSVIVSAELTAIPIVMQYWTEKVPDWAWSGIWLLVIFCLNLYGARSYAEAEYWFAVIKILAVLIFIIVGCFTSGGVIGGTVYGFKYWANPGAFSDGVLGVLNAFVLASFSMQGTEIVGITAGESEHPTKDIPRAIRNVFWRLLIFYLGSVFVMGMILPWNMPELLSKSSNVTVSPFTLVFKAAGLGGVSYVMNAVILITVMSCGNSGMYVATRTLCALSKEGYAHRKLGQVNKRGVPIYALICTTLVSLVTFATSFIPGKALFLVLTDLSGVAGFVTWFGIAFSRWRFRRAWKLQRKDTSELLYHAPGHPWGDLFAMIACPIVALIAGYSYFSPADPVGLVGNYAGLVCVAIGYCITKLWTRSKMIPLSEIDLDSGRDLDMEQRWREMQEEEAKEESRGFKKYIQRAITIFT
ncbi:amino acid permease/ SLC12A domain-containing protein [Umbelopsis sp. PMI_123]|nr:amino acid permease/ SLC12A domain-containing protein [Umbelopsis sp. PMI_123]